ncbi:MAG: hypothetical protein NC911_03040 [Candidatus Omnitrophica bacterium]|nr:hypothetical protein [Candidatus Omnitrophota bacterium]
MEKQGLKIGWAQVDITPKEKVLVSGQFHARVSEGVRDPITATALALEGTDQAVMVSCDLVTISNELQESVRTAIKQRAPGLEAKKVFLNATHTHTAPEPRNNPLGVLMEGPGVSLKDLGVMNPADYVAWAAEKIAEAVVKAWGSREEGSFSYGLGQAVVGHNRRWTNTEGISTMYGNTNDPKFSHIEGYEDHSVNLLYTWDKNYRLTGVVINLACPSQESESEFTLSADFWYETRVQIRKQLGDYLFVLPQCSPAGDQSPHHIFRKAAEERMLRLAGRDSRQEIAMRITHAVETVLPLAEKEKYREGCFSHLVETVELPLRKLSQAEVKESLAEARKLKEEYEKLKKELEENPDLKKNPRWYVKITYAYRRAAWFENVANRYQQQQIGQLQPYEIHVIRLGDIAIATNPFEYFLDYGIRIQARSPAVQNFLIQLVGSGTYVPTLRAVAGKGYGAVSASNHIGPEGGALLVEKTLELLYSLWKKQPD